MSAVARAFTALLACLGLWACGSAFGANLLRDGGFEGGTVQPSACSQVQGRLPMGWSDNSCWNASTSLVYDQDAITSRGGKSVKVTLNQGLFQLAQTLSLPADQRLTLSLWVRAAEPMMVKVALRQVGPPYADYGSRYVRATDRWEKVSVTAFSHGLRETDARQAYFMVSSATPGTLWIDDAILMAEPQALSLPSAQVPRGFFGTHVLFGQNMRRVFAKGESEAGAVRLWDSEMSQWDQVQKKRPAQGKRTYRWAALDERVDIAQAHDLDLLMVLGGYAPAWASLDVDADDTHELGSGCFRCDQHPRRMADWQNWVTDLATRFKGRSIRHWETWNEPSFNLGHEACPGSDACQSGLGSGYRGTPEQLLALQNEAAAIIRKIDPQAKMVSPGISYLHREYLDYFLKIGGGRHVDVIGYHLYLEGPPELLMSHVLAVRALMRDAGVGDKPLWSTETGIPQISVDLDPACRMALAAGAVVPALGELGPAYLARMMVLGWASGLGRIYQYAWDGQHGWPSSPTRTSANTNAILGLNEAGVAYNQVAKWMTGRRMTALDTGAVDGVWRATLQDAKGAESLIVWHPARHAGKPAQVQLGEGNWTRCDLAGACRAVGKSGRVEVDFKPVLLKL